MDKLIQWHKNYYYKMLDKLNISSYQAAWASWLKGIVFGIIIMLLCGCGTYQLAPVDKCCETDVVYLDEIKGDSVNLFTSLEFNTITLDFKPRFYRGSDWYWGRTYGYWGHRPLWMDFDFYFGSNYYSYYNPYYSYYRPWNYWDWYMRPWRPANNWYQGPFNNQSYNVVYNASRRGSLTSNLNSSISNRIQTDRVVNKRPVNNNAINTLISNYKPNNNNNYKPSNNNNIIVKPNNNWKPSNNNNYKPSNNYSRPSNNYSKPSSNYSRPSSNVISRPSSSPSRGGKINNR